ncbi:caspase family protein [Bradyrhizobium liaoningense]|uniref:caspase family protein n=1 Tax=Bradyrhizobium liaoningense TaxID=43992 RepID=UPI001BA484D0|nr:caspase family protein [Bradyrhizobium liaoningense]MBR0820321.1 caspase family protein [Bradyrhizobium liaoningense]
MKSVVILAMVAALLDVAHAEQPAAPCRVNSQKSASDPALKLDVSLDPVAKTGQPSKLSWNVSQSTHSGDLYLIVATPSATRFSGDGFIAVPAGARAPRSIKAHAGQTRLVAPLAGAVANPQGSASILFYATGQQKIDWAIVEISSGNTLCNETLRAQGSASVNVLSGSPQFVAQDRFATGDPKSSTVSSDGRTVLFEFADRYQVFDKESGDLLVELAGTSPRFSPFGRYISARGGSGRLQIFDVVAQRVIFETDEVLEGLFGGAAVGLWMDHDAILILGYGRQGAVSVSLALIDTRHVFSGSLSCNACHAFGTTSLSLDLDTLNVQFDDSDDQVFSLLEVADSAGTVKLWDESKPEDRGPAPKRPRFAAGSAKRVGTVGAELLVPASEKKEQDEASWEFSDEVKVSFYRVWNGDVATQRTILAAHSDKPVALPAPEVLKKVATRGKVSKRMVEVGGVRASPRNSLERLAIGLQTFKISVFDAGPVDPVLIPQSDDYVKDEKRAAVILQNAMAILAKGRAPLIFRSQANQATHRTTLFAKSYGMDLSACAHDEGPEEPEKPSDSAKDSTPEENPPVISGSQLVALWTFQLAEGTLLIAQQQTRCGTAPDKYGDLIAAFSPRDMARPITHARFAASYSDAGAVSDPEGIDAERAESGAALALDIRPRLQMTVVDQRWLVVSSRDSGGTAVFEVPSMKRLRLVRRLDNPLDLSAVTMTTDHRTLVQMNRSGALSFYAADNQEPVLRGRVVDDELVLFDASLNYEATPEGASYVYVQVPGNPQLFTLDQFSKKLALPSLAEKRVNQAIQVPPPPAGLTPPSLDVVRTGTSFDVHARSETALAKLTLVVDGFPVRTWPLSGLAATVAVPVETIPVGRWLSFSAEDASGIRSVVRSFKLTDTPYAGTLRVLALGANKFKASRFQGKIVPDLTFAKSDARRFESSARAFLAKSYGKYDGAMFDVEARSRDELIEAIRTRAIATRRGDTLILFFASHGASDSKGFNLLIPGAGPTSEVGVLSFAEMASLVGLSEGRVLIFLDACHSADATQDAASEQLAAARDNIVIIAASKGRQSSLENKGWGGGAFTSAVVEAFKSARPGEPLGIEKLYAEVRKSVVAQTSGRQTPWFRRASWQGEQSIN